MISSLKFEERRVNIPHINLFDEIRSSTAIRRNYKQNQMISRNNEEFFPVDQYVEIMNTMQTAREQFLEKIKKSKMKKRQIDQKKAEQQKKQQYQMKLPRISTKIQNKYYQTYVDKVEDVNLHVPSYSKIFGDKPSSETQQDQLLQYNQDDIISRAFNIVNKKEVPESLFLCSQKGYQQYKFDYENMINSKGVSYFINKKFKNKYLSQRPYKKALRF